MLRHRHRYVFLVLVMLLVPVVGQACVWDEDTIRMERSRFPYALELITGKFLRHSTEFYEWRIQNRLERLRYDPKNVRLLDDLAVAYDKTGQHDKAIETALRTEQVQPGRYETAANLGTFYFHAGKLEEGLPHIDRALAINPNAHFGREKTQKQLVEFAIFQRKKKQKEKLLPSGLKTASTNESPATKDGYVIETFADYLVVVHNANDSDIQDAVKGILGIFRFGKHDSPMLLEALGYLLLRKPENQSDGKQLAARAFLKASYELPEGNERDRLRELARSALDGPRLHGDATESVKLNRVEEEFRKELDEGKAWYADLLKREQEWVRNSPDPEAEFNKLYSAEPELSGMDVPDQPYHEIRNELRSDHVTWIIVVTTGIILGAMLFLFLFLQRQPRPPATPPASTNQ